MAHSEEEHGDSEARALGNGEECRGSDQWIMDDVSEGKNGAGQMLEFRAKEEAEAALAMRNEGSGINRLDGVLSELEGKEVGWEGLSAALNARACLLKRQRRLRKAKRDLEKAAGLEDPGENPYWSASTRINLAATLSALGEHEEALGEASRAASLLRAPGLAGDPSSEQLFAVAEHNMATELDHLGIHSHARRAYACSAHRARSAFGSSSPTACRLHSHLRNFRRRYASSHGRNEFGKALF